MKVVFSRKEVSASQKRKGVGNGENHTGSSRKTKRQKTHNSFIVFSDEGLKAALEVRNTGTCSGVLNLY